MSGVRTLAALALVLALGGATTAEPKLPPGATVGTEAQAREVAFRAYVEKMKLGILAEEGITGAALLALGYDVPGFAKRRDPVWEVRIETISLETRALIWVHALSGMVLFVVGPWDQP